MFFRINYQRLVDGDDHRADDHCRDDHHGVAKLMIDAFIARVGDNSHCTVGSGDHDDVDVDNENYDKIYHDDDDDDGGGGGVLGHRGFSQCMHSSSPPPIHRHIHHCHS